MRANKKRDTKPERAIRSLLHRAGLRYRTHHLIRCGDVSVRPDVVFSRARVAVFVDGCFWHQCPQHGNVPRANTFYWGPKLDRNARRDVVVNEALKAAGWQVVRVWEHEAPAEAAVKVECAVTASRFGR
jgi:DNA mismatch endonuclease (patch repair protein)